MSEWMDILFATTFIGGMMLGLLLAFLIPLSPRITLNPEQRSTRIIAAILAISLILIPIPALYSLPLWAGIPIASVPAAITGYLATAGSLRH